MIEHISFRVLYFDSNFLKSGIEFVIFDRMECRFSNPNHPTDYTLIPQVHNLHFLTIIAPTNSKREAEVLLWAEYMHCFLKSHLIDTKYELIVVKQGDDRLFKRGNLFNVGVLHSNNKTDYFIFQDLDLLPMNGTDYSFNDEGPVAMAARMCNYFSKTECKTARYVGLGGVAMVSKRLIYMVNGFSNQFWGWFEFEKLVINFSCSMIFTFHASLMEL